MSAQSRREQQKAQLRGIILDAAREVFVREGPDQVSMRKLAEKIEYSPGAIYLHFSSKEALLNSLVEESFAKLSQALAKTASDDPVESLRRALRAYVEFGLKHPNHYHFAFVVRRPATRPYRPHSAFEYLRECVHRCINAGVLRRVDPETGAQVLWAAVHGLTSLLIARPNFPWVRRDKLIKEMLDTATQGLLARGQ